MPFDIGTGKYSRHCDLSCGFCTRSSTRDRPCVADGDSKSDEGAVGGVQVDRDNCEGVRDVELGNLTCADVYTEKETKVLVGIRVRKKTTYQRCKEDPLRQQTVPTHF